MTDAFAYRKSKVRKQHHEKLGIVPSFSRGKTSMPSLLVASSLSMLALESAKRPGLDCGLFPLSSPSSAGSSGI